MSGAATRPVIGRLDMAQFFLGASRRFLPPSCSIELVEVNHQPALIGRADGRAIIVLTIGVEEGRVKTLQFLANPEKLSHV